MSTTTDTTFYTYPSVSGTIFDVPEPKDISAKFEYNYFLPDERESTNTVSDPARRARHRGNPARQVVLTFSPLSAVVADSPELSEIQLSNSEKQRMLSRNTGKIMKETEFLRRS